MGDYSQSKKYNCKLFKIYSAIFKKSKIKGFKSLKKKKKWNSRAFKDRTSPATRSQRNNGKLQNFLISFDAYSVQIIIMGQRLNWAKKQNE